MDPYAAYYAGQGYGWPDASQYPGAGRSMAHDIHITWDALWALESDALPLPASAFTQLACCLSSFTPRFSRWAITSYSKYPFRLQPPFFQKATTAPPPCRRDGRCTTINSRLPWRLLATPWAATPCLGRIPACTPACIRACGPLRILPCRAPTTCPTPPTHGQRQSTAALIRSTRLRPLLSAQVLHRRRQPMGPRSMEVSRATRTWTTSAFLRKQSRRGSGFAASGMTTPTRPKAWPF